MVAGISLAYQIRTCFDHFIPETTIVDLLDAYYLKENLHNLSQS